MAPIKINGGPNFFIIILFYSVQGVGGVVEGGDIGGGGAIKKWGKNKQIYSVQGVGGAAAGGV